MLRGTFSSEYQNGTVDFYSSQGATPVSYEAKIKWRGGSTNTEGKHKRNYKLKFKEKQQFFGLKADKNWILDAVNKTCLDCETVLLLSYGMTLRVSLTTQKKELRSLPVLEDEW